MKFQQNRLANEWEKFFDSEAPNYLENVFTKNTENEITFLLQELQLEKGASILDVGCGVGRHSIPLALHGYQVTGIDLSSGMLTQAKATAELKGASVDFVHMDASKYSTNKTFDAAICLCEGALGLVGSNHNSEDYDLQILKNVFNCLKSNGKFILTTMNGFKMIREYNDSDVSKGIFDPMGMIETTRMTPTGISDGSVIIVKQRHYIPSEFRFLMKIIGFDIIQIRGGTAGDWTRDLLRLDDWEFMVIATKP